MISHPPGRGPTKPIEANLRIARKRRGRPERVGKRPEAVSRRRLQANESADGAESYQRDGRKWTQNRENAASPRISGTCSVSVRRNGVLFRIRQSVSDAIPCFRAVFRDIHQRIREEMVVYDGSI